MPVIPVSVAEGVPEKLHAGKAGHDDRGPERDVLKDQSQAVVTAVPGHHLGLGAKVAQEIGLRYLHMKSLPQPKTAPQQAGCGFQRVGREAKVG
jgi:hypothetical protein